jgi:hypothetical protein
VSRTTSTLLKSSTIAVAQDTNANQKNITAIAFTSPYATSSIRGLVMKTQNLVSRGAFLHKYVALILLKSDTRNTDYG